MRSPIRTIHDRRLAERGYPGGDSAVRKSGSESHESTIECQADLRELQDRPPRGQGLRDLHQSPAQAAAGLVVDRHRGSAMRPAPDRTGRRALHQPNCSSLKRSTETETDASYSRCRYPQRQAHGDLAALHLRDRPAPVRAALRADRDRSRQASSRSDRRRSGQAGLAPGQRIHGGRPAPPPGSAEHRPAARHRLLSRPAAPQGACRSAASGPAPTRGPARARARPSPARRASRSCAKPGSAAGRLRRAGSAGSGRGQTP